MLGGTWNHIYPSLGSPFNRSPRNFNYMDNVHQEWDGVVVFDGGDDYCGPSEFSFSSGGGPYKNDKRPIRRIDGLSFSSAGTKFITVTDRASGVTAVSNPIIVEAEPAKEKLFWGDIHSQTIFSDGLRCPEELHAFARDEGFLDIFALSDHVEALTDTQWNYFVDVTNAYNTPGRFVTLIGQEWTNHEPGHRNIYYRGDSGPIIRCTDERYDTLEKLYSAAGKLDALLIPHHPANVVMGVDWSAGYEPDLERLVEIYSVWGNSERSADQGNPYPVKPCGGEKAGQHVFDALNMGRRLGIIGGGDIHDGRPGDDLHRFLQVGQSHLTTRQGIMGVWAKELTREAIFDALWNRRVYATTNNRTFLKFSIADMPMGSEVPTGKDLPMRVYAAAESPITRLDIVRDGKDIHTAEPQQREVNIEIIEPQCRKGSWYMVRIMRRDGGMAWSSPIWVS